MRCFCRVVSFMFLVLLADGASAQRSTPVQLLHPSGVASDQFGQAVAVNGDTMIVGAPLDDLGSNAEQGSAHVYRWSGSGWVLEATLAASDGAANDRFGSSVALSGDTAIIGAFLDDVGANGDQGSAYVFVRSGTTWTQQAKLTANNGASGDLFGFSVGLSGNTAIVGAYFDNVGISPDQGSAYIFTRAGAAWTQQAQLTASDGAANDNFGISVAISGDTALVGSYLDDVGVVSDQGSAYVFTRSGSTWTQQAQLSASDGAANDRFGVAVGVSGDTVVVGAYFDDVGLTSNQGSAYVFTRTGAAWTQQAQLVASDGAANDQFGLSLALSGDTAVVGSYLDDLGANSNQGSAYVFVRSGIVWTQQAQLVAPDGAASDGFGVAVASPATPPSRAVTSTMWGRPAIRARRGSSPVSDRRGSARISALPHPTALSMTSSAPPSPSPATRPSSERRSTT